MQDSKSLNWTTAQPTASGWYWARGIFRVTIDKSEEITHIVKVDYLDSSKSNEMAAFYAGGDNYDNLSEYTHWSGPLTPPDF